MRPRTKNTAVKYISEHLLHVLLPGPLPDDNFELILDFLLSLETRTDLTTHDLKQVDVKTKLRAISQKSQIADDSQYLITSRSLALLKHWGDFQSKISKLLEPENLMTEYKVPPLELLPAGKPSSRSLCWMKGMSGRHRNRTNISSTKRLELWNISRSILRRRWRGSRATGIRGRRSAAPNLRRGIFTTVPTSYQFIWVGSWNLWTLSCGKIPMVHMKSR